MKTSSEDAWFRIWKNSDKIEVLVKFIPCENKTVESSFSSADSTTHSIARKISLSSLESFSLTDSSKSSFSFSALSLLCSQDKISVFYYETQVMTTGYDPSKEKIF